MRVDFTVDGKIVRSVLWSDPLPPIGAYLHFGPKKIAQVEGCDFVLKIAADKSAAVQAVALRLRPLAPASLAGI